MMASKIPAVLDYEGKELLNFIQCPSCRKILDSPTYICDNGHNICMSCKGRLKECTLCGAEITDIRNRFTEDLSNKFLYHCLNVHVGCDVIVPGSERVSHARVCKYRLFKCFFSACNWVGMKNKISEHFILAHKEYINIGGMNSSYKKNELHQEILISSLLQVDGETFWYVNQLDQMKHMAMWCVQYLGDDEDASKFTYELNITSDNEEVFTSMKLRTHPLSQHHESIMAARNCMEMGIGTLLNFINREKKIRYTVSVRKNQDE